MAPLSLRMSKFLLNVAAMPGAKGEFRDGWGSAKGLARRGLSTFPKMFNSREFSVSLTEAGVEFAKTLDFPNPNG